MEIINKPAQVKATQMTGQPQPRVYMARITHPIGDYCIGDIVEVSRAPVSWQIAGTQSSGWIVTAAGKRGTWISDACARESLATVRNTLGKPYRVTSSAALCRRAGYVRHMDARMRSRRSVPQSPPVPPTPVPTVTEAEALANGIRLGITGDELDAYIYLAVKPDSQIAKVLNQTAPGINRPARSCHN